MKILFLMTARGGSKGIKNKNLMEISNMTLIKWKSKNVLKHTDCTEIILSTDSELIADEGKKCGLRVPFLRPSNLATDDADSIDVILHALAWLEQNENKTYDAVFLLEPSTPFLTLHDIESSLAIMKDNNYDSVLGVTEHLPNSIFVASLRDGLLTNHYEKIRATTEVRRQKFEKEYILNGSIYIVSVEALKRKKRILFENSYGYIMEKKYSIEIDEWDDLYYSRYLVEQGIIDKSLWR